MQNEWLANSMLTPDGFPQIGKFDCQT